MTRAPSLLAFTRPRAPVAALVVVAASLALAGCDKKSDAPRRTPPPPATVTADGTRTVPVHVNDEGFEPAKISARAGEKLELEVTRKSKSACAAQVKVGDGPVVDLAVDQPVKLAVTVPASGEVRFACGMDMMTGVVVVE
ncbi:MAG: cupredoxin domain-containing protein [Kofleriaceae bacterium]|nr:cupredoxin domain-containing protein [Kofleriaceae bacterium]MCL4225380.1 cupredoxin domain-containing protein [Myxococcales bacterium]